MNFTINKLQKKICMHHMRHAQLDLSFSATMNLTINMLQNNLQREERNHCKDNC
jgi:hypothetical protein